MLVSGDGYIKLTDFGLSKESATSAPYTLVSGRAMAIPPWIAGLVTVEIVSVYADVMAPAATTAMFLSAIAAGRLHGGTRIIGGDCNLPASDAGRLITHGVVHAAEAPTCFTPGSATAIDYFIASPCLGPALTIPTVAMDALCAPHTDQSPSRLRPTRPT